MRISCCVPGCKRTVASVDPATEWLCAKHWPFVAKDLKGEHRLVVRRLKRKPYSKHLRLMELQAWDRCKVDAIEKALGIR